MKPGTLAASSTAPPLVDLPRRPDPTAVEPVARRRAIRATVPTIASITSAATPVCGVCVFALPTTSGRAGRLSGSSFRRGRPRRSRSCHRADARGRLLLTQSDVRRRVGGDAAAHTRGPHLDQIAVAVREVDTLDDAAAGDPRGAEGDDARPDSPPRPTGTRSPGLRIHRGDRRSSRDRGTRASPSTPPMRNAFSGMWNVRGLARAGVEAPDPAVQALADPLVAAEGTRMPVSTAWVSHFPVILSVTGSMRTSVPSCWRIHTAPLPAAIVETISASPASGTSWSRRPLIGAMRSTVQAVSPVCGPWTMVVLFASQSEPKPKAILHLQASAPRSIVDLDRAGAGCRAPTSRPWSLPAICQSVPVARPEVVLQARPERPAVHGVDDLPGARVDAEQVDRLGGRRPAAAGRRPRRRRLLRPQRGPRSRSRQSRVRREILDGTRCSSRAPPPRA